MDAQTETSRVENQEFEDIMERIRKHTGGEDGVEFIKDMNPNEIEVTAVNRIYDGLLLTLETISEDALERVKKNSVHKAEYEEVLRAMEPITQAVNALADNKIPLRRATIAEEHLREEGDTVRIFTSDNFDLEGAPFDFISVFIRPKTYVRPSNVIPKSNPNRPQMRRLIETKQPRMSVRVVPKDNPSGFLEIRLDQEDITRGMQISYDIIIGEEDALGELKFSSESGQRYGHHFNSGFTAQGLGVSFEQILNAMGDKIDRSISEPQVTSEANMRTD